MSCHQKSRQIFIISLDKVDIVVYNNVLSQKGDVSMSRHRSLPRRSAPHHNHLDFNPPHSQPPAGERPPTTPQIRLVPLEQIVPNLHQPRREFDEAALQELADSIRQHGVLQPILLRQRGDNRFEIVAGERRFRASKLAGLKSIPAFVRKFNDKDQAEISLIENLQREDLSPVEMARAFRTLIQQFGLTQQELSHRVGKSQPVISQFLHLLELPDKILDSLECGDIQEGHARALLRIEDEVLREQLWQQVLAEGLSVRKTEKLTRTKRSDVSEAPPSLSLSLVSPQEAIPMEAQRPLFSEADAIRLETQLTHKFERRVVIQRSDTGKGSIQIGIHDSTDLLRIAGILLNAPA
jgi:ParB family transcriptional regulator, chromosome partitioning protein